MTQKGLAPILIVVLIALALGGYFIYQKQISLTPTIQPSPTSTTSPASTDAGNISPDGSYMVSESLVGDYNTIAIKDRGGNIIVDDLVAKNSKEIYNMKFKCQCGTSFKKWVSNTIFSIKIVNGGGEEYEYLVDASSGKVDESSFKRIK